MATSFLLGAALLAATVSGQAIKPVNSVNSSAPQVDVGYAKFQGGKNSTSGINYFRGIQYVARNSNRPFAEDWIDTPRIPKERIAGGSLSPSSEATISPAALSTTLRSLHLPATTRSLILFTRIRAAQQPLPSRRTERLRIVLSSTFWSQRTQCRTRFPFSSRSTVADIRKAVLFPIPEMLWSTHQTDRSSTSTSNTA